MSISYRCIPTIASLKFADPAAACSLLDHNAGEARRREERLLTWRFSIKAMLYIDGVFTHLSVQYRPPSVDSPSISLGDQGGDGRCLERKEFRACFSCH